MNPDDEAAERDDEGLAPFFDSVDLAVEFSPVIAHAGETFPSEVTRSETGEVTFLVRYLDRVIIADAVTLRVMRARFLKCQEEFRRDWFHMPQSQRLIAVQEFGVFPPATPGLPPEKRESRRRRGGRKARARIRHQHHEPFQRRTNHRRH